VGNRSSSGHNYFGDFHSETPCGVGLCHLGGGLGVLAGQTAG
jgi:hypothetical protein